jgi:hypothetical protein
VVEGKLLLGGSRRTSQLIVPDQVPGFTWHARSQRAPEERKARVSPGNTMRLPFSGGRTMGALRGQDSAAHPMAVTQTNRHIPRHG